MSIEIVHGSIFDLVMYGKFSGMVHGANCFHTMGAGVAQGVAHHFPSAVKADRDTPFGDPNKLGTISCGVFYSPTAGERLVINAYTQFMTGRHADLDSIVRSMEKVIQLVNHTQLTEKILVPKIGCGIGGLQWEVVSDHIAMIVGAEKTFAFVEFD